jgi:integrase
VHGSKRDAQRALAALVTEVSAGKVTVSSVTLGEVLEEWLDLVEERLSPTTMREYRRLVAKSLGPALGATPLRKVTTQRLDAHYTALSRTHGLSPATIRHLHAVLRGALDQAVRWGGSRTTPPRRRRLSGAGDLAAGDYGDPGPARGSRRR